MSNKLYNRTKYPKSNLKAPSSRGRRWLSTRPANTRAEEGPYGPAMVCEIFNTDYYDGNSVTSLNELESAIDEGDVDEVVEPSQLDLPLENLDELERKLRNTLRKFEDGYEKMAMYALQWHYLMEDCEEHPQLEKMFKDLQMMRRMTGSDAV